MSILREAMEAYDLKEKGKFAETCMEIQILRVGGALNKSTTVIICFPNG